MNILKTIGWSFFGVLIIASASVTFARIQHYPIPNIATIFNHTDKQFEVSPKVSIPAVVKSTVKSTVQSANASQQSIISEGPDTIAPAADQKASSTTPGVPVLMYHYVGDLPANAGATRKDLTVSTANFTQQVQWLKSQGYQSINMNQLYAWLKNGTPIPVKSVVFTFDDGYTDTFDNAIPVLEANKMSGSFGIITGLVSGSVYASWNQISTAKNQGMQIVSHSYSHPVFSSKSVSDQTYEITKSDMDFNTNLGFVPNYFIYPFGKYNSDTESILKANGFLMSFTTAYGFVRPGENLLELPRVRVHGAEALQTFEYNIRGISTDTASARKS